MTSQIILIALVVGEYLKYVSCKTISKNSPNIIKINNMLFHCLHRNTHT